MPPPPAVLFILPMAEISRPEASTACELITDALCPQEAELAQSLRAQLKLLIRAELGRVALDVGGDELHSLVKETLELAARKDALDELGKGSVVELRVFLALDVHAV